MKVLCLSLLTALLSTSAGLAAVFPAEIAGSYQALLFTESADAGSPAGLVALTVSTKGAVSGKLTTNENKTYAFKTTLDYTAAVDPGDGEPIGTAVHAISIPIKRGKLTELSLALEFQNFSATEQTFEATLTGEIAAETEEGFKVKTYAPKTSAPTMGAYTMALELADEPGEGDPAGSGYGIGKIDAKGILKIIGKTGDGTAFTASLPNGPANQFVMFVNPYKRAGSFLGGKIALSARADEGFHMMPAETGYDFQWKKTSLLPKTSDKSYRNGFGPLDVLVSMEPWIAPGKGQTVANLFDLNFDEVFELAMSYSFPLNRLPTSITLDSKNAFVVTSGGTGSPSVIIGNDWSKLFTGKVDPKSGKLTASLNLEDEVEVGTKTKKIKRKVVIEGVLLRLENPASGKYSQGFALVPPLDPKAQTMVTGMLAFPSIQLNPQITIAAPTAGTYSGVFQRVPSGQTVPAEVPAHNANITFTVSPDLKSLVFDGRTLSLSGDSRPVALSFVDPKGVKLGVTLRLRYDGVINHFEGFYGTGFKSTYFLAKSNTVVKQ